MNLNGYEWFELGVKYLKSKCIIVRGYHIMGSIIR